MGRRRCWKTVLVFALFLVCFQSFTVCAAEPADGDEAEEAGGAGSVEGVDDVDTVEGETDACSVEERGLRIRTVNFPEEILQNNIVIGTVFAIGGAVLAGAAAMFWVSFQKKRERKETSRPTSAGAFCQSARQSWTAFPGMETTVLESGNPTSVFWGNQDERCALVLTDVDHLSSRFEVTLSGSVPVVIGRDQGCQIVLLDQTVSGTHCRICLDGGRLKIMDLDSTNGTIVNGNRIVGEKLVDSGDILGLGNIKLEISVNPHAPLVGRAAVYETGVGLLTSNIPSLSPKRIR